MPVAAEGFQEENVPHKNQQKGPSWEPVKPEDNHVIIDMPVKYYLSYHHFSSLHHLQSLEEPEAARGSGEEEIGKYPTILSHLLLRPKMGGERRFNFWIKFEVLIIMAIIEMKLFLKLKAIRRLFII